MVGDTSREEDPTGSRDSEATLGNVFSEGAVQEVEMSGGRQIPDEWVEEEYPAVEAGSVVRFDKWTTGRAVYPGQRERELAEMRRADVEAR